MTWSHRPAAVQIGQSGAIAKHLADKALSHMTACEAEDLFNMVVKAHANMARRARRQQAGVSRSCGRRDDEDPE